MKHKKMIVVDLDGTLLNSNKKCSERSKNYLINLRNKGHIIVIATGRILKSAIQITDGAPFANYIISDHGGAIYDMTNKKVIFKNNIPSHLIQNICSLYDGTFKYIDICNFNYCYKYTNEILQYDDISRPINDKENLLNYCDDVHHLSILLHREVNELYQYLTKNIPELDFIIMQDSFSDKQWIDVLGKNVSKYNSIKIIAELENISNDDIIAFGDGLNDIDMIQNCGIGVAMGNALEKVKSVANFITTSHDEDGIVYFLEKYLK